MSQRVEVEAALGAVDLLAMEGMEGPGAVAEQQAVTVIPQQPEYLIKILIRAGRHTGVTVVLASTLVVLTKVAAEVAEETHLELMVRALVVGKAALVQ
jgi:hypothetical protein